MIHLDTFEKYTFAYTLWKIYFWIMHFLHLHRAIYNHPSCPRLGPSSLPKECGFEISRSFVFFTQNQIPNVDLWQASIIWIALKQTIFAGGLKISQTTQCCFLKRPKSRVFILLWNIFLLGRRFFWVGVFYGVLLFVQEHGTWSSTCKCNLSS